MVEVFGPTIQGEGPEAGTPCYFVRFGGCDFRCSWCDSMYAVEPAEVRKAERLDVGEIVHRIQDLDGAARWVILSGGNPALHHLAPLTRALRRRSMKVAVETQGSMWRDWLGGVDRLVISPKPPSSGMTPRQERVLPPFMHKVESYPTLPRRSALKIVVRDDEDLAWAKSVFRRYPFVTSRHLSVLTDQDHASTIHMRVAVCDRFRWLAEKVAADPALADVRVSPQMHVLAWGAARGV